MNRHQWPQDRQVEHCSHKSGCGLASPIRYAFALLSMLIFAGCGETREALTAPVIGVAPYIVKQPISQTLPLGSQGALSAQALGTNPLSYQWYADGQLIPGASASTYVTLPLTAQSAGTSFYVIVSNSDGTVTSVDAVISVGARSPDPRDLRFKHVDLVADVSLLTVLPGELFGMGGYSYSNVLGSPLEVGALGTCSQGTGPGECAWAFDVYSPPASLTGFTAQYLSDSLTQIDQDFAPVADLHNAVVTALDEQADHDVFALTYEQDSTISGGYDLQRGQSSEAAFSQLVQGLAAQGRVITAATMNGAGLIDYASYTWSGAANTAYEATVLFPDYTNVEQQAAQLAAAGYILTATGTTTGDGFVLVGTRVQGDTLSRPFFTSSGNGVTTGTQTRGEFPVAKIFDQNGNTTLFEQ